MTKPFRLFLRPRRLFLWGATLTLVAIFMCATPLLGTFGFEFAMFLAFFSSLAGLDLGSAETRATRKVDPDLRPGRTAGEQLSSVWLRSAFALTFLLAFPLVCVLFNAMRVRVCAWGFGAVCFLFLPLCSGWLCAGLGSSLAAIGGSKKRGTVLPYIVFVFLVAIPIYRFYATPPVFSYNLLIGYFPGNLYDELIGFRSPFYFSRLEQILGVFGLHCIVSATADWRTLCTTRSPSKQTWRLRRLHTGTVICVGFATLFLFSGRLGYAPDVSDLARRLGGVYETDRFIIHYPDDTEIAERIEEIADDHDFRLSQVEKELDVVVPEKIRSFYFSDPDEKYRAMGARRVYMAKPWRREIYLNDAGFPHQVLRHELVHVVAAEFADSLFGVSAKDVLGFPLLVTVGLVEGIAVAMDWPDHFVRPLTPHQSARAMTELGVAPPIEDLMSPGFLRFSSARSYTVAGSFVRWLSATRGIEKVRILYANGGDVESVYQTSMTVLAKEWREFIATVPLPKDALEVVRERYRRRSIFSRPCPHAIANWQYRAAEAQKRRKHEKAISLFQDMCRNAPKEPNFKIALASGYIRARQSERAQPILEEVAANTQHTSSVRNTALQRLAGISVRNEEWPMAVVHLESAAALPLGDHEKRNAQIKLAVAREHDAVPKSLIAYLWPEAPNQAAIRMGLLATALFENPDSGLVLYLVGRNLADTSRHEAAAKMLSKALRKDISPLIRREAARLLAAESYLSKQDGLLKEAASILMEPAQPLVMQLYGQDWLARLAARAQGK